MVGGVNFSFAIDLPLLSASSSSMIPSASIPLGAPSAGLCVRRGAVQRQRSMIHYVARPISAITGTAARSSRPTPQRFRLPRRCTDVRCVCGSHAWGCMREVIRRTYPGKPSRSSVRLPVRFHRVAMCAQRYYYGATEALPSS
jgi:hypothetical protein